MGAEETNQLSAETGQQIEKFPPEAQEIYREQVEKLALAGWKLTLEDLKDSEKSAKELARDSAKAGIIFQTIGYLELTDLEESEKYRLLAQAFDKSADWKELLANRVAEDIASFSSHDKLDVPNPDQLIIEAKVEKSQAKILNTAAAELVK